MKRLCLFALGVVISLSRAQADSPKVRIAKFAGDRAAAISYTFDDGLRDQYTVAVPMLNEAGLKGTFFVIPGKVSETVEDAEKRKNDKRAWGTITWPELKEMAVQGHEIASHTWSHPGLAKLTPEEVDEQFTKARDEIAKQIGTAPLTLAFPFNQSTPEIQAAALKYYQAYRSYQKGLGGKDTAESLNTWADRLVQDGKWGVLMAHGIAYGYSALADPEALRAHLKHVKDRNKEIWVDTFANVARYEKERDDAKLSVVGGNGKAAVNLTSSLDPKTFNVPLTVVLDASGATAVSAERAGQKLPARIVPGGIQVDAAPSAEPITVTWR